MKIYFIVMVLFTAGFLGARTAFREPMRQHFGAGLYVSVAVILFAGFSLHNSGLFVAISGLALLLSTRDRLVAVCRLAMLVALIPDIGYDINVSGHYVASISTTDGLTVGAYLACLFHSRIGKSPLMRAEGAIVLLLMFIFSVAQTRTYTITGVPRDLLVVILGLGLPFLVFSRNIRNREEFGRVVGAIAGAAIILSIAAIYEAKFHWSIYEMIWRNNSTGEFMSRNLRIRAGFLRTPTTFRESTSFAVFQLVGVFATVASRRLFRNDLFWLGCVVLTIVGVLAAQSRGADIGLLFGFFALMLVRRRYGRAFAVAAVGATAVALLLLAAPSFPKVAAFLGADSGYHSDADYRQLLLRRGLEEGMKHPIIGDDRERVLSHMADITQGEGFVDLVNTYLVIFLYSGLVGLTIFLGLLVRIFQKSWPASTAEKRDIHFVSLQVFIFAALGGELLSLLFTSFWERNPYWLMIMFAGCGALRVAGGAPRATEKKPLVSDPSVERGSAQLGASRPVASGRG